MYFCGWSHQHNMFVTHTKIDYQFKCTLYLKHFHTFTCCSTALCNGKSKSSISLNAIKHLC